jgi:outer membrane lipoprotein SlyB
VAAPPLRALLTLLASAALVACSTKRPVLYPNAHYQRVGTEVAELDVEECMEVAEEQVGLESAGEKVAKDAAIGGGSGAAVGGAAGAVRGNAGSRAAAGAAAGATAGVLRGLFRSRDPDPVFKGYVQVCLAERGYKTIGWR